MPASRVAVFLLCAILPVSSAAESFDGVPFGGEVEFDFARSTGNTESRSLGLNLGLEWVQTRWREHLDVEAYNESQADETAAERYYVDGKVDHALNDREYLYTQASAEDDRFSGYEYRLSASGGYGYRVYDRDDFRLELEAGPGYRHRRARPVVEDAESGDEATLRAAGRLFWQINPYTEFQQQLESVAGTETTVSRSTTRVTTELWSRLALRLSYRVRHVTNEPEDVAGIDTRLSAGVVYGF